MSANKLSFSVANILGKRDMYESDAKDHASQLGILYCEADNAGSETESIQATNSTPSSPLSHHLCQEFTAGGEADIHSDGSVEEGRDDTHKVRRNCTRRGRMRFTPDQVQVLEKRFQEQHYLLPADRKILALALRMTERQVKTWFQNKRAQYKRTRPLVRNPIYHNIRPPLVRQPTTSLYSPGITPFSLADLSVLCMPTYPPSPTYLQVQQPLTYHPSLFLPSPMSR